MEVGESVNVPLGGSATAKQWKFRAEILEVTFKGVKVTRGKKVISPPHWKKGEDMKDVWSEAKRMSMPQDAGYSKKPAAMLIQGATGATQDVELKVHVTESENVSAQGDLVGRFGDLEITGKLPLSVGQHTVMAKIKTLPEVIAWYRCSIDWSVAIADPGTSITLGGTVVEIFFLPAVPLTPFKEGVWAEALRFLCTRAGVVGQKAPREIVRKITRYCHSGHELTYDTKDGNYRYGSPSNRQFMLSQYMEGADPECNCYDQASAVQVLSAVLGVKTTWLFMLPFGYIQPADLVGVGQCNNPVFRSNNSKPLIYTIEDDFNPLKSKRQPFDTHAFCEQGAKIFDACVGPHLGTENREEYLRATIDYTPRLYPSNWPPAGTVSNIEEFLPMINIE